MDLFDYMRTNTMKQESPLASRMRPETVGSGSRSETYRRARDPALPGD